MLKLNILPEKLKKEIKLFSFYSILKNILLVFVFITSIMGIVFLLSDEVLQTYINNSGTNRFVLRGNSRNLDEEIKQVEKKIEYVMNIQEEDINWSKLLEDIMSKINDGIVFSKIAVDREKYQLNLFGQAETRSDLIELRGEFEDSDTYLSVDFPIKNILEKNNISFNMLITVDPYDFK